MSDTENILQQNIDKIKSLVKSNNSLIIKSFDIGKKSPVEGSILYINGLSNKELIDRDILKPLMLYVKEDLSTIQNLEQFLNKKYITISNSYIETDINRVSEAIKRGKSVLLIQGCNNFIIIDTTGGEYRTISDPENETAVRGPRDSFVEKLESNISVMKRRIKDKNLMIESFTLGRRSQTDTVLMYIDDIVDKKILEEIRNRISSIDIDNIQGTSIVDQCIEKHPFSFFPQTIATERPDKVQAKLMEGKIALIVDENPFVSTFPTTFFEFFQTVEDYYFRTIVSSFTRLVRYLAAFIILSLPSIYITLIKFNAELIPSEFIKSIVESRKGIVLTPFMSILSMNLIVEFLREGGLRLPGKIGQTLSVVGGIIIGDAALKAKIVSSLTLLIVGTTTVATFLIPNYEMALSIRLIGFINLIMSNWLGMLGLTISLFFLLAYLCSLDSYGVPYLTFKKSNEKTAIIRAPIWMLKNNSDTTPNNNPVRQGSYRWKFRRKKNG
ncbi:spore germination protein [Clostridium sp. PL3]|uniref:Spore germination protein n=1 Tax=Clostridium thailandense TaxID=2794346 RepID=A0A949X1W5_9CLOT|nr:spore germination protein [Clostridium thailandense]MBV7272554.1 spore germination protein [Clostridium thailandense]